MASDMTPDGLIVSLLTRAALLPEQPLGFFAFDVYVLNMRPATALALMKIDSHPFAVRSSLASPVTVQNPGRSTARDITLLATATTTVSR